MERYIWIVCTLLLERCYSFCRRGHSTLSANPMLKFSASHKCIIANYTDKLASTKSEISLQEITFSFSRILGLFLHGKGRVIAREITILKKKQTNYSGVRVEWIFFYFIFFYFILFYISFGFINFSHLQILVGLPNGEGLTAIRSLKELDDIQFIIGGRIIEIAGGICHKTESTAIED